MISQNNNKQTPWRVVKVNYGTWEESEEILMRVVEKIIEAPLPTASTNA